ncbi:MAG: substrate-binding periplasmic protein [Rheinheimera sp.]
MTIALRIKAVTLLLATFCVLPSIVAAKQLTFCYQDKELVPYYLGHGNLVNPDRPGATIEHLQLIAAKVPGLQVDLVRYPWQRCLKYLQDGDIDAVVANYAEERLAWGVFPLQQNQPDPNREFAMQEICMVTRKALAKRWNGSHFEGISKVVVAIQAGRNVRQSFNHRQFSTITISAQAEALQMLAQNKVQAVTMVCKIAGKSALAKGFDPETMQVLTPSIETLHGHLIFSKQFYQAQPDIAEALWAELTDPPVDIYLKYLNTATTD